MYITMTRNHIVHGTENETEPFLWNNSFSKSTLSNDFHYCDKIATMFLAGQPRRVSFTQQDANEKVKKSVRFSSQLIVDKESDNQDEPARNSWNGKLTQEHREELWYQKRELVAIKQEAKVLIANRSKIKKNPNASSEERDNLVGLERFNRQRAGWKKNTIRFVLIAQNQMRELHAQSIDTDYGIKKEDYIREISLRCSEWARLAAEKQGFRDYCAVHDPLASLFSDSEFNDGCTYLDDNKKDGQNYNELIFGETTASNSNNKRQFEQTQIDNVRQVRSRTDTRESI